VKNHGPAVYFDTSTKKHGKGKLHNCYRADITVGGKRYRRRGSNPEELRRWLKTKKEARDE
jgi:hypothetical protein